MSKQIDQYIMGICIMNIIDKLEKIIYKYSDNICNTCEDLIKKTLLEIIDGIDFSRTVGIKGSGEHTRELLCLSNDLFDKAYIFDKKYSIVTEREYNGVNKEVFPDSYIEYINPEYMIISSYAHKLSMRREIEAKHPNVKIIDIYEEMAKRGVRVNSPFYRCSNESYDSVLLYKKIYNENPSKDNLINVVLAYLRIRDFIGFNEYADLYIKKGYIDSNKIQGLKNEINELLDEIRVLLKQRNQKDIIMLWNDQFGITELGLAPYFEKISNSGMFFENAYAVSPYTFPAISAMVFNRRTIDDRIYLTDRPIANATNSKLIRIVEDAGYSFVYDGDESDCKLFESKYCISNEVYNSSCIRYFKMLQYIIQSNKPVFCILHALVETHNPYMSADLDSAKWYEFPHFSGDSEEDAMAQMKVSLKYWDRQVEFYSNMFSDKCVQIFMSDHGKRFGLKPAYKDASVHIIFFIYGDNIPKKRFNKVFSIYDLYKVIGYLLSSEYAEEDIFSEYVILQETNIFNATVMQYYYDNNAMDCTCAFRSVRTINECYVRLDNGKCFYYLMPDEDNNLISDQKYKDRVEYLSSIAGDYFEDTERFKEELDKYRKSYETHE